MIDGQTSKRVLVIGELNVDFIATGLASPPILGQEILADGFQMTLGSASAIFACGAAQLGHPVTFVSRVGRDELGAFCLNALRQAGISVEHVQADASLETGVTISLSTTCDRALVTFLGAIAELSSEHLPLDILAGYEHLHLTSYFLQHRLRPAFPEILRAAKQKGLTTSFDPNSDPSSAWGNDIREVLKQTDVLFLNETEALQLTRCGAVSEALKHLGATVRCVVIKLGARGATAILDGETVSAPGFSVAAVDTTGAGDSFAAGFLHGYLAGRDLQTCLSYGNACGALSTLKAGGTANQPTREQLDAFLQTYNDAAQRAVTKG